MQRLQQIALPILLTVVAVVVVQVVWWQIGLGVQQHQVSILLHQLVVPAGNGELWLHQPAAQPLLLEPIVALPPLDTVAVDINQRVIWTQTGLLVTLPWWPLVLVYGLIGAVWSVYLRGLKRQQQLVGKQRQQSDQIRAILDFANLPVSDDLDSVAQLEMLQKHLLHQQRRDEEIKRLVRVQGLLDQDLAIGNRIYFESKLQHYLTDSAEVDSGALFLIQLRHPESDVSQAQLVQRLSGCAELIGQLTSIYELTVIARVAENDLALLIPGLEQKDAATLGDRLAMVLSRAWFFQAHEDYDVIHLGYVVYNRGQTSYQVMAEADMALKTAQLQGPNAAFGFVQNSKPKIHGSVWWRTELANALQHNRLLLNFQPVFSWAQGDVIEHEVLVRLHSSEGDKLTAAEFLPMAANCGMALAIDQAVLLKVGRLIDQEKSDGSRCTINLSCQSILQAEFIPWLEQQVAQGLIAPQRLGIEIDEHHAVRHFKALKPKLLRLHQLGFVLVIDHAGLTLNEDALLPELPLESVKLHPSVVRHVEKQLEQQLFIRGMVASYHNRGVRVLASGVETEAEWQCLQKLGVSGAQGFYFSQPLVQFKAIDSLN
ncbi:MAG TPA: GGDEF domain-containing protein [Rheinheimera sp.]|nr:GGDEF domain-containing protein [Rheinheimera sp.]